MNAVSQDLSALIRRAADLIRSSHRFVALTGAGLSTPSGLPDFRSEGSGLWTRFLPMEVGSLTTFRHNPELFFAWLRPLASHMLLAEPNPAHYALASLEKAGYLKTIVTQNIDGLHHRAGGSNILEIHGTFNTLTCARCYRQVGYAGIIEEYLNQGTIPRCQQCGGILKPDVILFEEQLPAKTWLAARKAVRACDLLLIAGTSLEVMPSAKLPMEALENGAHLMIVNRTETYIDVRAEVIVRGDVAEILPKIAREVLHAQG